MNDDRMTVEERAARQSEIRARLAEIDTEHSGAALPEEIQREWDDLNTEHDAHEVAIRAANERASRIRSLADEPGQVEREAPVDYRGRNVAVGRPENLYDLASVRQQARSIDELPGLYRDRAMRAVEQARFPGVGDRSAAQEQVERLLDSVDDDQGTLARRVLVTGSPTYERAFGKALTSLSMNGLTAEEQRALSLGSNPGGGFAVPFQLDPTVILTSGGQVDPIRQIARTVQITGKEWQGITSAGISVTRAAEAAPATDNSPTLAQPTVTPTRVQGFVPFSIEIDQDWGAMRSEITMMLGEAKATEESQAFTLGDGTGNNPSGVVATLATSSHVDAAGEGVTVDDVYAVEEALPPRFRANGRWLANRSIYNVIRRLDTAGGANLWVRLLDGLPPELIGYPTYEASAMDGSIDDSATGTNLVLLFGDFSKFLIVDRVGMSVELVPHLFQQATAGSGVGMPTGQRGIYAIWRNSSKILADNAFRLLKVTTSAT
jgi:HK97 family phage major capsid protein